MEGVFRALIPFLHQQFTLSAVSYIVIEELKGYIFSQTTLPESEDNSPRKWPKVKSSPVRTTLSRPDNSLGGAKRDVPRDVNPLMVTSKAETMVLPVWELALPLPGVLMIAVGLYMIVLGMVLWLYHCLRDRCTCVCGDCCPEINPCEQCLTWGEMCDCQLPNLCSCLDQTHPTPSCPRWDCACTCQPPECESFNCLCFEIKIR